MAYASAAALVAARQRRHHGLGSWAINGWSSTWHEERRYSVELDLNW